MGAPELSRRKYVEGLDRKIAVGNIAAAGQRRAGLCAPGQPAVEVIDILGNPLAIVVLRIEPRPIVVAPDRLSAHAFLPLMPSSRKPPADSVPGSRPGHGLAIGVVAGQTSGAVEEGKGSVWILEHPDPCLDVVVAVSIGWDLQAQPAVAHGVVVADGALCVDAEDLVQRACEGDEGGPFGFGRGCKAGVVERQVDLFEEAVGLGHVGDAGEPEFLGQALLQGPEHALGPPPGLGRIGRDQLDAELHQGPADLGRIVLVHFAAGLGRVPVVAGAVGIERAEQPAPPDHLGQRPQARHRALLVDEEGRVDRAGGVVHGHDQVPPTARNPRVARAILVHHHAGKRTARTLAPVCAAPGRRAHAPACLQGQPHPVVAARAAVLGDQLLVEVLGGEVPVAGVEQRQHPRHLVHRRAPRRNPAQAAVVETVGALRLVAIAPAPEGPLRHAQHLRRLGLAQQP